MDRIDKIKSASNESSNTNKYRVKKNTLKRKKQDLKFGSSAQGQGFTMSRKLKAMRKYGRKAKSKNDGNSDQDDFNKDKFDGIRFNKFEHTQKKHDEKIAANKREREEREKERELHKKTVTMNLKQRRKLKKDLSKKTKKGQLVMANQMQHLLQKIQSKT